MKLLTTSELYNLYHTNKLSKPHIIYYGENLFSQRMWKLRYTLKSGEIIGLIMEVQIPPLIREKIFYSCDSINLALYIITGIEN